MGFPSNRSLTLTPVNHCRLVRLSSNSCFSSLRLSIRFSFFMLFCNSFCCWIFARSRDVLESFREFLADDMDFDVDSKKFLLRAVKGMLLLLFLKEAIVEGVVIIRAPLVLWTDASRGLEEKLCVLESLDRLLRTTASMSMPVLEMLSMLLDILWWLGINIGIVCMPPTALLAVMVLLLLLKCCCCLLFEVTVVACLLLEFLFKYFYYVSLPIRNIASSLISKLFQD